MQPSFVCCRTIFFSTLIDFFSEFIFNNSNSHCFSLTNHIYIIVLCVRIYSMIMYLTCERLYRYIAQLALYCRPHAACSYYAYRWKVRPLLQAACSIQLLSLSLEG